MATTSSASPHKNRYTLSAASLLLFFLLSLFFFSRSTLEPKLSLYRDLFTQTSLDPSRSAEILVASNPEVDDTSNATAFSDDQGLNTSSSTGVPILSNSNLDEINEKSKVLDTKDAILENPTSLKSDFEDKNSGNAASVDAKETAFEELISSKSGIGDETNGKTTLVDSEGVETNNERIASSNSQSDDTSNPAMQEIEPVSPSYEKESTLWQSCDFYKGTWVRDDDYPVYRPGSCPYVDEAFDCQNNGRPDSEYLKWRWKPDRCDIPRFNASDFLVRLRGKKLMLVGDSMNRNQFESLLCLLREGLQNKSKMYEVHGYKITKGRGYYIFKFEDYNCTVDFVRSHFLVKEGVRINAQGNSNPTLSIDRIDKSANRWKRADILVFNTGHWWTHGKTARGKNYYKEGDYIYPRFDPVEAYRRALKTWGKWVDRNTTPGKLIIYRGYSSAHFRGGDWDSGGTCNGEKEPVLSGSILHSYPLKMKIVDEVIQGMQVPVVLLNVTGLTNFRKDGHPSVYGKNVTDGRKVSTKRQDCSHWCLPGVPDAWNELIYAALVTKQTSATH